ncbi:UDP-N-acetyl-D-mannosamine dehydrogenase [Paraoerskovia marina]|uniref:UDP-N-acetyl-D-mannosamine dehydrogenase n=1 Tax=Paraoerskovia marina TaxID=545619 RepID=UPI0009DF3D66|nr:UDP-N-acetyl-D-mannosamine dehydrogenase [Paraoerskovia marina]
MSINTVAVVGLGYIGLPTAAILASKDIKVIGIDVNTHTVDAVNRGDVPFIEPDLAAYVAGAVTHGTLRATSKPEPADAFIVAVPTPFKAGMKPDLSYIEEAAKALAPCLRGGELVVLESTSPPTATAQMAKWILDARPDLSIDGDDGTIVHFAHCPERVLPGRIMIELVMNSRVIGGLTREAGERARELYRVFCQGDILLTDATTAEMTKLAENTFRDINIAFANELASICDRTGVDVWELIALANNHPRVQILRPGPGVGGHCIAVDPWFLIDANPESANLIRAARQTNDAKPRIVVNSIIESVRKYAPQSVALIGLTFKSDVEDTRESPSMRIAEEVATQCDHVQFYLVEPHLDELPPSLARLPNTTLCASIPMTTDLAFELVNHQSVPDETYKRAGNVVSFVRNVDSIGEPS